MAKFILSFCVGVGITLLTVHSLKPHDHPTMSINNSLSNQNWGLTQVHLREALSACPDVRIVIDEPKSADYALSLHWTNEGWLSFLARNDDAILAVENGPDYMKLLRSACRKAESDDHSWMHPTKAPTGDRFDLRDIHNGPTTTTALVDKRTGKVWIWTDITDNNGKKTGRTEFLAEDVSPPPEEP